MKLKMAWTIEGFVLFSAPLNHKLHTHCKLFGVNQRQIRAGEMRLAMTSSWFANEDYWGSSVQVGGGDTAHKVPLRFSRLAAHPSSFIRTCSDPMGNFRYRHANWGEYPYSNPIP